MKTRPFCIEFPRFLHSISYQLVNNFTVFALDLHFTNFRRITLELNFNRIKGGPLWWLYGNKQQINTRRKVEVIPKVGLLFIINYYQMIYNKCYSPAAAQNEQKNIITTPAEKRLHAVEARDLCRLLRGGGGFFFLDK